MVAHQLADDPDRPVPVGDTDVDVHAADQQPASRPLEVLDEVLVPLLQG